MDPIGTIYKYLTNDLAMPSETILGLALIGVLVGVYWILSSREVEVFLEEIKRKRKE